VLIKAYIKAPLGAFIFSIFYLISFYCFTEVIPEKKIKSIANKNLVKTIENILKVSEEWHVDAALILAVAHTESSFNHSAVSSANAYGLMQVVPSTAGKDIAKWLTGSNVNIPPDYLLQPEKNLMMGAAYLNYLQTHYFSYIKNKDLNRLLTIVAYNGGIGTIIRTFRLDEKKNKLRISQMSYKGLYKYILNKHPFEETRNYLIKVEHRYAQYKKIISQGKQE